MLIHLLKVDPYAVLSALAIDSNRQIHSEDYDASASIHPDEYVQMMSKSISKCGQN